jgi:hypothetical protein
MTLKPLALSAYLIVAVVTFGHCAHERRYGDCVQVPHDGPEILYCTGFPAALAAIAWPLYWSWEVQS